MKNSKSVKNSVAFYVDEVNNSHSFGYVKSREKIMYNIYLLRDIINMNDLDLDLSNSKHGLTTLFPLGTYIIIFKIKKDKNAKEMIFYDFRMDYAVVDKGLKGAFSEDVITQFKRIKYEVEEYFDESVDDIVHLRL